MSLPVRLSLAQLTRACAQAFPTAQDHRFTTLPAWDSLDAMRLLVALEAEAQTTLDLDRLARCHSYRDLLTEFGPAPKKAIITDADDNLAGWLPADHASFNGKAPHGAQFGYNFKQHSSLANSWPPLPMASHGAISVA